LPVMDVTLYTRQNCPLCDKAREAIRASGATVRMQEVDIDRDESLRERYTNEVPVILIDGQEAFRHRLSADAFNDAVRALGNGWTIVEGHHLEKQWTFPDFKSALAFTNRVGALAEEAEHHPDIHLAWGKVRIVSWTHTIDRLSGKDFALAAAVDGLGI
jgi:4a-hydroxytetrahydrobiopterin dehydratase